MKKIFHCLLLVSIVTLAIIPMTTFAATLVTPGTTDSTGQSSDPVMIASLSIDNLKYSYNDVDRKIQVSFDLSNEDQSLNNVGYSLLVSSDNGAEKSFVYNRNLFIASNSKISESIDETIPDYIFGNVNILVQVSNSSGIPLGVRMRDGIMVSKIVDSIHVDSSSCYLTVSGNTKYNLIQGVDVDPTEQLFLNCGIIGNIQTPFLLTLPSMRTYERSISGPLVDDSTLPTITLKKGDSTIKIPVKIPTKPQAYSSIISVLNGDKSDKSIGDIEFHYVVRGESGTMNMAQTDKTSYVKGDIAQLKILWSPRADYFPGARASSTAVTGSLSGTVYMTSNGSSCGDPVSFTPSKETEEGINLSVPMKIDCNGFSTRIEVKDADRGNVIVDTSFNTPVDPNFGRIDWLQYIIAIGSLLIAIILIVVLIRLKKKHLDSKVLLIAFFLLASTGIVQVARAYTLTSWFAFDGYVWVMTLLGDFEVYRSSDSATSGFKVGDSFTVHDYKNKVFMRCGNGAYVAVVSKVTVTGPTGQKLLSTSYRKCDGVEGKYCINDATFSANSVGTYTITVTFKIVDNQAGSSKDMPFTKTITISPEPGAAPAAPPTPPASLLPVTGLASSIGSCGSKTINLSWDIMSGATQYVVTRTGSGSTKIVYINQPVSTTRASFSSTGLLDGAPYQYSVKVRYPSPSGLSPAVTTNVTSPAVCGQPTVSLRATPASITVRGVSALTWESENATSCTTSGDWLLQQTSPASPFGGVSTGVLSTVKTYTYNIVCTGPAGTSPVSTATVTVVPVNCIANPLASGCPQVPVADPVISCSMTASPTSVNTGGTTTLTWNSSNATICVPPTGTGSSGTTPYLNGSTTVHPYSGHNTFTLSCSNTAILNSCSAPVTVSINAGGEAPTASPNIYLWFGNRSTPLIADPDVLGHMNNQTPLTVVFGEDVPIKFSWPDTVTRCNGYELSGPDMTTSGWTGPLSRGTTKDTTTDQLFGSSTLRNLPVGTYNLKLSCGTDRTVTSADGTSSTVTDTSFSANSIKLYVIKSLINED
ncbi:MAG: hypothetical protein WCP09_02545 [Candidatus Taylorbacteria bacterium]